MNLSVVYIVLGKAGGDLALRDSGRTEVFVCIAMTERGYEDRVGPGKSEKLLEHPMLSVYGVTDPVYVQHPSSQESHNRTLLP